MNEYKSVPNIRFKGFEDEWKEKKFGSLFNHNSGTSIEKYFNSDGKYKVISIGSYGKNSKYIDQGIRVDLNSVTKSHLVDKNDLTMVLNDKTSDGQIIGRVLLINKSNEYVINQRTERLIPRNINSKFAFIYLNGPIRKSIKKMVQGGTQIYVNYSSIEKINAIVPKTMEEQRKIGDFFSKLDKLLDLQQQKVDKLELLKKALLQKLFPKYGAKIPELRFKEFKNEWEKEKLKGHIEKVSGNDGRMNLPTLTISAAKGWMNQNERFSNNIAGKEQKNYTLLKKGELSYNHGNSKLFKYGVVYELINYDEALVPKVYHSFRVNSKASARFIEYLFRGKKVDRELRKLVTSGARMDGLLNINFNNFENIKLYFPEKAEQQKIGNLLSKVDQLIELENKKLEDLQQVKKCLLQNMFVE